jgi:ribosome-associated translation inhibitor RaiA
MKKKTKPSRSQPTVSQPLETGEGLPPAPVSPVLIQTSFRHMPASPAVVTRVEHEVGKLHKCFDGITHCHVVVVAPHRHLRLGRRYALHIELSVPRERLVITHEPAARPVREASERPVKSDEVDAPHKDVYVAIRDAFAIARRRLLEYVRRLRGEHQRHRRETPGRTGLEPGVA